VDLSGQISKLVTTAARSTGYLVRFRKQSGIDLMSKCVQRRAYDGSLSVPEPPAGPTGTGGTAAEPLLKVRGAKPALKLKVVCPFSYKRGAKKFMR